MMLVDGSMTGVPVMPISGLMSPEFVSAARNGGDGSRAGEVVIGVGGIQERALPEDGAVGGVDGVQGVVLRGDKNDRIVGAGRADRVRAGSNGDVGQNQRLGIDLAVQRGVVELAEIGGVDVRRRQLRLGQVGPGRLGINVVLRDIRREQATILESLQERPTSAAACAGTGGCWNGSISISTCVTPHNESAGELFIEPWIENIFLRECKEFPVTVRLEDAGYPGINRCSHFGNRK